MLKHQQNETIQPPKVSFPSDLPADAAQVRVTPAELTQALNALQASKEEEASRLNGTLSIGQAVEEMGLDSTPEEIWNQIQAQRLQQEQKAAHKRQPILIAESLANTGTHASKRHRLKSVGQSLIRLIARGYILVFGKRNVRVNEDHAKTLKSRIHSLAVINGDNNTITFSKNCDILIVNGDDNTIDVFDPVNQ